MPSLTKCRLLMVSGIFCFLIPSIFQSGTQAAAANSDVDPDALRGLSWAKAFFELGSECYAETRTGKFRNCLSRINYGEVFEGPEFADGHREVYLERLQNEIKNLRLPVNAGPNSDKAFRMDDRNKRAARELVELRVPDRFTGLESALGEFKLTLQDKFNRRGFFNTLRFQMADTLLEACGQQMRFKDNIKTVLCIAAIRYFRPTSLSEHENSTNMYYSRWPFSFIPLKLTRELLAPRADREMSLNEVTNYVMSTLDYWIAVDMKLRCLWKELIHLKGDGESKRFERVFEAAISGIYPSQSLLPTERERFREGLKLLRHIVYGSDTEDNFDHKNQDVPLKIKSGLHTEIGLVHFLLKRSLRGDFDPAKDYKLTTVFADFDLGSKSGRSKVLVYFNENQAIAAPHFVVKFSKTMFKNGSGGGRWFHQGMDFPRVKSLWPSGFEYLSIINMCQSLFQKSTIGRLNQLSAPNSDQMTVCSYVSTDAIPVPTTCFPLYGDLAENASLQVAASASGNSVHCGTVEIP